MTRSKANSEQLDENCPIQKNMEVIGGGLCSAVDAKRLGDDAGDDIPCRPISEAEMSETRRLEFSKVIYPHKHG